MNDNIADSVIVASVVHEDMVGKPRIYHKSEAGQWFTVSRVDGDLLLINNKAMQVELNLMVAPKTSARFIATTADKEVSGDFNTIANECMHSMRFNKIEREGIYFYQYDIYVRSAREFLTKIKDMMVTDSIKVTEVRGV